MISSSFTIQFDFVADRERLKVPLTARIETHHSEVYYVVGDIRPATHRGGPLLPDIRIKKRRGKWVHTDSEKESMLSQAAGKAIDRYLRENAPDGGQRDFS